MNELINIISHLIKLSEEAGTATDTQQLNNNIAALTTLLLEISE